MRVAILLTFLLTTAVAVPFASSDEAGEVKALWIMATNPAVSLPDSAQVRRALEGRFGLLRLPSLLQDIR